MRYLTPHVILRKSIVAGVQHPNLARDMGLFLARCLFRGSCLSLSGAEARADMTLFAGNVELSDITRTSSFPTPISPPPATSTPRASSPGSRPCGRTGTSRWPRRR